MVRATHKFVEAADAEVLRCLDLEAYLHHAIERYVEVDRTPRLRNVWGKDEARRRSTLLQIAQQSGLSRDDSGQSPNLDEVVVERLSALSFAEARDLFGNDASVVET